MKIEVFSEKDKEIPDTSLEVVNFSPDGRIVVTDLRESGMRRADIESVTLLFPEAGPKMNTHFWHVREVSVIFGPGRLDVIQHSHAQKNVDLVKIPFCDQNEKRWPE